MEPMSLIAELKRRNVIRVGAAYIAFAWLIVQILDSLGPVFGIGDGAVRAIVILLAIGLVPVLVVSWLFELTPEGFAREASVDHDAPSRRDAARRLDRILIGTLAVAVSYFAFDKFVLDPARDAEIANQAAEQARDAALVDAFGDHSIAVMPFADLSPDKDQEYFSDGIAEEIINLLSRIRNLRVIARSSSFAFKGENLTASEIAERLDVAYVMEGAIRRQGERLRITATMIDGRTNSQLWSERFDRDFGDVFAIQDAIASQVVERLELQIGGGMPLADRVDPQSYTLFLQARHLLARHSGDPAAEADRLLDEALALDPSNVAAWLLYRRADRQRLYWGQITRDEFAEHLRGAMNRVLEIDPGNPEAQLELAILDAEITQSLDARIAAVSLGLELLPADAGTHTNAAWLISGLGYPDLAGEYYEYVLRKDPLCARCLRGYMYTLMEAGDYAKAEEINRRYRNVTGGAGTYMQGLIQLLQGDAETALATFELAETIPFVVTQGKALAYWSLGRVPEAEAALAELEAAVDDPQHQRYAVRPEDFLVRAYAWFGRSDDALDLLEAMVDPPASSGPERWNVDPLLKSLHEDPRWTILLTKAGLAPSQLERFDIETRFPGPDRVTDSEDPLAAQVLRTVPVLTFELIR
jgi:TolB-like protein